MTINATCPNRASRRYARLFMDVPLNEALEMNKKNEWIRSYYQVGDILIKLGHRPTNKELLDISNMGKMSTVCVLRFYKSLDELGAIPKPQSVII